MIPSCVHQSIVNNAAIQLFLASYLNWIFAAAHYLFIQLTAECSTLSSSAHLGVSVPTPDRNV